MLVEVVGTTISYQFLCWASNVWIRGKTILACKDNYLKLGQNIGSFSLTLSSASLTKFQWLLLLWAKEQKVCDWSLASRNSSHAFMISLCQKRGKPASPFVESEALPLGLIPRLGRDTQSHRMAQLGMTHSTHRNWPQFPHAAEVMGITTINSDNSTSSSSAEWTKLCLLFLSGKKPTKNKTGKSGLWCRFSLQESTWDFFPQPWPITIAWSNLCILPTLSCVFN